jgi:putative FmdB family regulatory protein
MPTYEYECNIDKKGCGYKFEVFQNMKDEPLSKCPNCKKRTLKKIFGVPAVIFKGSGFYETDYKEKR